MSGQRSQLPSSRDGLLDFIESEHQAERTLCDMLERIADNLPGLPDAELTRACIAKLRSHLKRHTVLEEVYLHPLLARRMRYGDLADGLLEHISFEHAADENLAQDTADQLERVLDSGRAGNPEMLGYMLRALFEGRRRHLAWEAAVILPLARRRLKPSDCESFSSALVERSLDARTGSAGRNGYGS